MTRPGSLLTRSRTRPPTPLAVVGSVRPAMVIVSDCLRDEAPVRAPVAFRAPEFRLAAAPFFDAPAFLAETLLAAPLLVEPLLVEPLLDLDAFAPEPLLDAALFFVDRICLAMTSSPLVEAWPCNNGRPKDKVPRRARVVTRGVRARSGSRPRGHPAAPRTAPRPACAGSLRDRPWRSTRAPRRRSDP